MTSHVGGCDPAAAKFFEHGPSDYEVDHASLKSRVFSAAELRNKPVHIYALVVEATKWSKILSPIIETTDLLHAERKLTPALALLLTHDLLLSKHGVAAPKNHFLRQTIEKHKARLGAAFTRARLKDQAVSVDAWRQQIEGEAHDASPDLTTASEPSQHPRWLRLNLLHGTSAQDIEAEVFHDWTHVDTLSSLPQPPLDAARKRYHRDEHIPNLIATPAGTDLSSTRAYKLGRIILQDKASCFPATLLDPQHDGGDVIDACAAPGNKTSHLVALLASSVADHPPSSNREITNTTSAQRPCIFAIERDPLRSKTLQTMLSKAGCFNSSRTGINVRVIANQDFLALDPNEPRFVNVRSILLDPSCSGSGIIGRDDGDDATTDTAKKYSLVLPRRPQDIANASIDMGNGIKGKKRKRKAADPVSTCTIAPPPAPITTSTPSTKPPPDLSALANRLASLSNFQHKLLLHASRFPSATRIIYSTCSIHGEENESVVVRALTSLGSKGSGWRILRRPEQPSSLRKWVRRGDVEAVRAVLAQTQSHGNVTASVAGMDEATTEAKEVADACIHCAKGQGEGTMGFFVAGFVRDGPGTLESRQAKGLAAGSNEGGGDEHAAMVRDDGEAGDEDGSWDGFDD